LICIVFLKSPEIWDELIFDVHISGLYWAVFAWGLSLPDPSGASEAARIACLDPQHMAIPEAHTWRITCPGRNRSDFFKWISPSVLWETEIQSNDLGWSLRLAAACCLCRSSRVGLGGHVSTCRFSGLDGVSLSQKLPRCISIYIIIVIVIIIPYEKIYSQSWEPHWRDTRPSFSMFFLGKTYPNEHQWTMIIYENGWKILVTFSKMAPICFDPQSRVSRKLLTDFIPIFISSNTYLLEQVGWNVSISAHAHLNTFFS